MADKDTWHEYSEGPSMKTRSILTVALIVLALGVVGWVEFRPRADRPSTDPAPKTVPTPHPIPVAWETLTVYDYKPGLTDLPASIRALEGKRVVMEGFLTPLYEFDDIHEFQLSSVSESGSGLFPKPMSSLVTIRISEKKGIDNTFHRLRVVGNFKAKEVFEQGYIVSIFEIDDATVEIL